MIFLDTCVWIELLGVRTPKKEHEIRQARVATELLENIVSCNETIVTCKEQMIELVTAIEKVTMRTVNSERKANQLSGIGSLKEFRTLEEFQNTKMLCEIVINDIKYFAQVSDIGNYCIEDILKRLDLADINDCLYYDYCIKERIDFYTFDSDLEKLGDDDCLHIYNIKENKWI